MTFFSCEEKCVLRTLGNNMLDCINKCPAQTKISLTILKNELKDMETEISACHQAVKILLIISIFVLTVRIYGWTRTKISAKKYKINEEDK